MNRKITLQIFIILLYKNEKLFNFSNNYIFNNSDYIKLNNIIQLAIFKKIMKSYILALINESL